MRKQLIYKTFSNIPTLETERLLLRRIKPADARDMFEYASRPDVTKYLLWSPHPDIEHTRQYIDYLQTRYDAGDFYDWALVLKNGGKMIGTCGFVNFDLQNNSAEIGYVLNPAYCGYGYATEAAAAVIQFGFLRLKLHRIQAKYMAGNLASRRVMEKLGMAEEGTLRDAYFVNGTYRTVTQFSILNDIK